MDYPFGQFYRLLLLLALRKNELAQAKWTELHPQLRSILKDAAANERRVNWAEIDPAIKLLTIPAARFKSNRNFPVPLPDMTLEILEVKVSLSSELTAVG